MSPTTSKSPSPAPESSSKTPKKSREASPTPDAVDDLAAASVASTSASEPAAEHASSSNGGPPSSGDWQAIWSPAHGAYYFFNSATQQTTWENPIQSSQPSAGPSSTSASPPADAGTASASATSPPASVAQLYALQEAAAAQGIDPSLAYLDPSLAGPSGAPGGAYSYSAKFNARTGTFTRPDGRDPTHLSEYERAKRMSEVYFDVGAWEKEVEQRKRQEAEEAESGKKRKRPSKKDVERFKEQKKQKKIAKTAWLRT
ncbi:hypothetical protein BV25DRAFT_1870322 [Artomyces pyxidatus]|uniref:Uncharacterized protein n=1 Tax=Artomyces pyxidatus TaxID=48021 RepID=A0ACB8T2H0_9AGAM|nr:hypothetical protein BV25DRAFT_1870322 [Artomyces pyxidatus]